MRIFSLALNEPILCSLVLSDDGGLSQVDFQIAKSPFPH